MAGCVGYEDAKLVYNEYDDGIRNMANSTMSRTLSLLICAGEFLILFAIWKLASFEWAMVIGFAAANSTLARIYLEMRR